VTQGFSATAVQMRSFYCEPLGEATEGRDCLVEAPGVEPGSEDLQCNGSTCVADRFRFAATHAHRLA